MTARSIRRAMERKAKKLEKKHLQTEMLPEARLPANQANAQLSAGTHAEGCKAKAPSAQGDLQPVVHG
jgi:hypothetical protein